MGGLMSVKVSWQSIYDDFRIRFPKLSKLALYYQPYNFMTIVVYLQNGDKLIYDGLYQRAWFSELTKV
jgi:hypothetical protein